MHHIVKALSQLPELPALYAMYGGVGNSSFVAYVGVADRLKRRIRQHLVNRDSSVTTGTSAVSLNPEYVTSIRWWTHPRFMERVVLEAAELVAFEVLDPVLRSCGGITADARLLALDAGFRQDIEAVLFAPPAGAILLPTLHTVIQRLDALEQRVAALELRA